MNIWHHRVLCYSVLLLGKETLQYPSWAFLESQQEATEDFSKWKWRKKADWRSDSSRWRKCCSRWRKCCSCSININRNCSILCYLMMNKHSSNLDQRAHQSCQYFHKSTSGMMFCIRPVNYLPTRICHGMYKVTLFWRQSWHNALLWIGFSVPTWMRWFPWNFLLSTRANRHTFTVLVFKANTQISHQNMRLIYACSIDTHDLKV